MKAKKHIKRVLLGLLLLVLAAGFTVGGRHVWNQYQEKKRLAQKPYFTEKISYGAMSYMTGAFHCESTPSFIWVPEEEDWPDYGDITAMVRLQAETVAGLMNSWLFEDPDECDRKAAELAEQYGFSAKNPITAGWVVGHPEDAVEIMQLTQEVGDLLRSWHEVYISIFEK